MYVIEHVRVHSYLTDSGLNLNFAALLYELFYVSLAAWTALRNLAALLLHDRELDLTYLDNSAFSYILVFVKLLALLRDEGKKRAFLYIRKPIN